MLTLLFTSFAAQASEKCVISGCSAELCVDADGEQMASICIWSEQFACYKSAKCEEQKDGKCGWAQTPELKKCLKEKNKIGASPMAKETK